MKKIRLTKNKFSVVDDEYFEYLNQWQWSFHAGYATRGIKRNGKTKTIHMHRVVMELFGVIDGLEVDHINGDKLDNRKQNLRICTKAENLRNRPTTSSNSSGYKGVYKSGSNWQARISVNKKLTNLGSFKKKEDAAKAYDVEAVRVYGEFAKTNF